MIPDPLQQYLSDANETLSSLAAKMGRPPSTLTRPLNGARNPSVSLAREVERHTAGKVSAAAFIELCMRARSKVGEPERASA